MYLVQWLCWGGVFLEWKQIRNELQFTKHFIEFVFVETNQFVESNPNVIFRQQICDRYLSMVAGSKRRGLAYVFNVKYRWE